MKEEANIILFHVTAIMQMILLYKDPEGKSVFERRTSAIASTTTGDKALMIQVKADLEMQVATLKRLLKERDDVIAEMKQEMAGNEHQVSSSFRIKCKK